MPYEYGQIILVPVADGHGDGNRDATGRKPGRDEFALGRTRQEPGRRGSDDFTTVRRRHRVDLSEALV